MILRRLGNKKLISAEIQKHFPQHQIYIEFFFGAGGMFFNKPKVKYNVLNDLDSDVYNLFNVVMNQKEELREAFYIMPIHEDLLQYWKKNKEVDPIKKALRFLMLSNFGYLGKAGIKYGTENPKNPIYKHLDKVHDMINDVQFMNTDFRNVLKKVSFRDIRPEKDKTFGYFDPPYLSTTNNYKNDFSEQDSNDCFDIMCSCGFKCAMSEFNHPFILEQAQERNLNVITIGERNNLKNRRVEILVTNYEQNQQSLF